MNFKRIANFLYYILSFFILLFPFAGSSQLKWTNVDSAYQPLPSSVHIYFTNEPIDTAPFRAYYLIADIKNKRLDFDADTTSDRRITPQQFYERDGQPLVVVNSTFFSYETNRSLNVVVIDGKLVSYNDHSIPGRGKDTFTYRHPFVSALGITRKRTADIAWIFTDPTKNYPYATEFKQAPMKDSAKTLGFLAVKRMKYIFPDFSFSRKVFHKWKMQTAVGGGPALVQKGNIEIANEEELKFTGKAINDKHPRTAMGYTKDGKLIILMIEGRNGIAHGATLAQEARILKDLGCIEAINLDGGGSSCMLVNGKETIKPSDKTGQRPIPAVFIIKRND